MCEEQKCTDCNTVWVCACSKAGNNQGSWSVLCCMTKKTFQCTKCIEKAKAKAAAEALAAELAKKEHCKIQ